MEGPKLTNTEKADRWGANVVRARVEIMTPNIAAGSHVMLQNPRKNFS